MRIGRSTPRKKDANQNEIVAALEKVGCSVIDASAIGGGFPDLIVGRAGENYLLEIKNPETKGKLNELQEDFFASWRGQTVVVHSVAEALDVVGIVVNLKGAKVLARVSWPKGDCAVAE